MKNTTRDVRRALMRAGIIRRGGSSFLTSFAIGAGVGLFTGAALALMVTPHSGPEMRRQLGTRAKKLAERSKGALGEMKANVKGRTQGRIAEAEGALEEAYRAQ
jgi:gas vesicle protein